MTTQRNIPSVERLLQTRTAAELIARFGRPLTLDALRAELAEIRQRLKPPASASEEAPRVPAPGIEEILAAVEARLRVIAAPTLVPVINATGVILHTNLGRAPLSDSAMRAMDALARGYSNLEYDL